MNRKEIKERIEYIDRYIELLYKSIDKFEEELALLMRYIETENKKMGEGGNEQQKN